MTIIQASTDTSTEPKPRSKRIKSSLNDQFTRSLMANDNCQDYFKLVGQAAFLRTRQPQIPVLQNIVHAMHTNLDFFNEVHKFHETIDDVISDLPHIQAILSPLISQHNHDGISSDHFILIGWSAILRYSDLIKQHQPTKAILNSIAHSVDIGKEENEYYWGIDGSTQRGWEQLESARQLFQSSIIPTNTEPRPARKIQTDRSFDNSPPTPKIKKKRHSHNNKTTQSQGMNQELIDPPNTPQPKRKIINVIVGQDNANSGLDHTITTGHSTTSINHDHDHPPSSSSSSRLLSTTHTRTQSSKTQKRKKIDENIDLPTPNTSTPDPSPTPATPDPSLTPTPITIPSSSTRQVPSRPQTKTARTSRPIRCIRVPTPTSSSTSLPDAIEK